MIPLRFGDVRFELHDGWSKTVFPDGHELTARHDPQPGQDETAKEMGFDSPEELNRTHDLTHCLFAYWMGQPYSNSLYTAARRVKPSDVEWLEEAAVLSIQAYAKARGIDLVLAARKITALSEP